MSCKRGSKAPLERCGIMIIEKGQATMTVSESMALLAMIESPEETTGGGMINVTVTEPSA